MKYKIKLSLFIYSLFIAIGLPISYQAHAIAITTCAVADSEGLVTTTECLTPATPTPTPHCEKVSFSDDIICLECDPTDLSALAAISAAASKLWDKNASLFARVAEKYEPLNEFIEHKGLIHMTCVMVLGQPKTPLEDLWNKLLAEALAAHAELKALYDSILANSKALSKLEEEINAVIDSAANGNCLDLASQIKAFQARLDALQAQYNENLKTAVKLQVKYLGLDKKIKQFIKDYCPASFQGYIR